MSVFPLGPSAVPVRLTHHASVRLQQRGIPAWFLGLLVMHGKTVHDHRGAVIKLVDKGTRRRLQAVLGRADYVEAERYFDVYAVVAPDDVVVTAAHRRQRGRLH
jgi:hypothetical protein